MIRRRHGEVELTDRGWSPAQRIEEDQDENERDPEVRERSGEHPVEEDDAVDEAASFGRHGDTERQADQDREGNGCDDELQRGRQALLDIGEDGLGGPPRGPEVTMSDPRQILRVLDHERTIEPEALVHLLDTLG